MPTLPLFKSLQKRVTGFYNFFTGHTPNQQTRLRSKISKKPLLEEPMA
jgi:hypothetical protein